MKRSGQPAFNRSKQSRKFGPSKVYGPARQRKYFGDRALVAQAARMKGSDVGFLDTAAATYGMDTTGSITLLNPIVQGAGQSQRVGKKVILKSLQCRGRWNSLAVTTFADGAYLIVYDRRPTGALPAITAILNTANTNSMNNDDNSGRFKILKRVDFTFEGNSATPNTGKGVLSGDMYLKLRGLPTVYKSVNTGAIADIEEGALYLVTLGDIAAGTSAASGTVGFRVRFMDV